MKEIKTQEELNTLIKLCNEIPFTPNKVKYQGTIGYIINSKFHFEENIKRNLSSDYFHPEFYFSAGGGIRIYDHIIVSNIKPTFDPRNDTTWVRVQVSTKDENRYETLDNEAFNKESRKLWIKHNEGQTLKVCIPEDKLLSLGFVKGKVNEDYWFHINEINHIDTYLPYKKFDNTYTKVDIKELERYLTLNNSSKEDIKEEINKTFKNNIKFGVDSLTYSIFEGINYTFGIEIETCIGRIPQSDISNLNVKAVHDGSLRDKDGNTPGGEYVTGILRGDAGLVQLHELCRVLASKCKINSQCGVHVHCGSLDWNKDDVVYAYLLAELIEQELFSILPTSRRNNSYCRPLTKIASSYLSALSQTNSRGQYNIVIDDIYNEIYKEVTYIRGNSKVRLADKDEEGKEVSILGRNIHKNVNHPLGSKCGYDKNSQRYTWLNFVTLLYLTKGKQGTHTLEFRNHGATMNFNKIRNWVKICFAFCKFVEIGKGVINSGKVTLEEVLLTVYPKTGQSLVNYINERKELFKSKSESIDYEDVIPNKKSIKEVVECV